MEASSRPDSCSRWGRGQEPHPGELGHRRLLLSASPAPRGGHRLKSQHGDPPVQAHRAGEPDAGPPPSPILFSSPHQESEPSTHHKVRGGKKKKKKEKKPRAPSPTPPRNPGNSAPGPWPAPPQSRLPIVPETRPRLRVPGGRLRAGLGSRPGPQARPCCRAAARVGEGWVPSPQRGARRLRGAASGRGRGRGGPRGKGAASPAPLQCPQSPSHYLGRERGGDEEGARVGTDGAQRSLGHPREPATGRVPGDLACGHPFQPGDGDRELALIGAKTSVRKQVALGSREPPARTQRKSRRPSPPEEDSASAQRRYRRASGAEGLWSGEGPQAFGRFCQL
ncbi:translation initiation factor IF-2-like [Meles meles]|uniref:translation initiation factor IF-2-like n=1 Tax=Meles meles TaxID=9662 RepID=UPI001E6A0918|nr:translation initiation factor IF-2-like [Meles meles]